jgi:hypothetical protein
MECWNIIQVKACWWALYRYFPSIVDKIGPDSITKPERRDEAARNLWLL